MNENVEKKPLRLRKKKIIIMDPSLFIRIRTKKLMESIVGREPSLVFVQSCWQTNQEMDTVDNIHAIG